MSFEMEVGLIVLAVILMVALLDIYFDKQFERATTWVLDTAECACTYIDVFFARVDKHIDDFFNGLGG